MTRPGPPEAVALATDLYELTMASSYLALDMNREATFSLVTRRLPAHRAYLVVAGLEDALQRLSTFHFDLGAIDYLRLKTPVRAELLERLEGLRFTGDVWAVPEGRVVFAGEPLLEVDAPLVEAQLVETMLLNAVHYPTAVATKAARCVTAAAGRLLVDFGARRMPGIEAGVTAARAAYIAGFDATSNLLAGRRLQVPVAGTLAHSFIEAFSSETDAMEAFIRTFPAEATLLIDTYDTLEGARHAIAVAGALAAEGFRVAALRLDSGDLAVLSKQVRGLLDGAGMREVGLFGSGGLDEYEIERLVRSGAPIGGFGVGTRLGMSADAPVLDLAYKLSAYAGVPRLKLSSSKETIAGSKQVWRRSDSDGSYREDLIATRDEPSPGPGWETMLERVMIGGVPASLPRLGEVRDRHRAEVARLPAELRRLRRPARYRVRPSEALRARHAAALKGLDLAPGG